MKWAVRIVWGLNALLWPFAGVQAYRFMLTLDDPVEIRFPMEKEVELTFPKPADLGPNYYEWVKDGGCLGGCKGTARSYGHSGYIGNTTITDNVFYLDGHPNDDVHHKHPTESR